MNDSPLGDSPLATENYWVECNNCHLAYVVRRMMSLSKGWLWGWQADCKCKKAEPQMAYKEGYDYQNRRLSH